MYTQCQYSYPQVILVIISKLFAYSRELENTTYLQTPVCWYVIVGHSHILVNVGMLIGGGGLEGVKWNLL